MAANNNAQLYNELRDAGKIQTAFDRVPTEIAKTIVPVIEVNPKLLKNLIVKSNAATNATSAVIYLTPSDQDFYLMGASISTCRDATATSTEESIVCTFGGLASQRILAIADITLNAGFAANSITFPHPIKVDRNTNISVTNGTNVANIKTIGIVYGYLDENSNN